MNKKIVIILVLLFFFIGLIEGYSIHEVKDKIEIRTEAIKLITIKNNINTMNSTEFENLVCGDINGRK